MSPNPDLGSPAWHAWLDATQQSSFRDTSLDEEALAIVYAYASDNRPVLRGSGAFGPTEIDVPESADTQTRLLGMLGRRVR